MISYLRISAAALLVSVLASPIWAASPQDAAVNTSGDAQASSLPIAPAPPSINQDFAIQQASDSESSLPAAPALAPAASQAAVENPSGMCDSSLSTCCCQPLWDVTAGAVISVLRPYRRRLGRIIAANPQPAQRFTVKDFDGWTAHSDITIDRRLGD